MPKFPRNKYSIEQIDISNINELRNTLQTIENKGGITSIQAGLDNAKPQSSANGALYLATDTKKLYIFNGANWTEAVMSASGQNTIMLNAIKREMFIAQNGQTVFVLTNGTYEINQNRISVFINGIKLPNQAFVETSNDRITLQIPCAEDDEVLIEWFEKINNIDATTLNGKQDIDFAEKIHTHYIEEINNATEYFALKSHNHNLSDIEKFNYELLRNNNIKFYRNSEAYKLNKEKVYNNIPRIIKDNNKYGLMIEEGTTNVFKYPLTQEYYNGTLRTAGAYYSTSNFKIIATNQPNGVLPGCKLTISSGKFTISGVTDLSQIKIYWQGFNNSNQAVSTEQVVTLTPTNGEFSITIDTAGISNLAYVNIGIGNNSIQNYYLEYIQVEAKPYKTSFTVDTRQHEKIILKLKDIINKLEGTIECKLKILSLNQTDINMILDLGNTGVTGFFIGIDPDKKLKFQIGNGQAAIWAKGNTIIQENTEYDLAFTWKNDRISIYLNGNLESTLNDTTLSNITFYDNGYGYIGSNTAGRRFLNGILYKLQISSIERSAEEIMKRRESSYYVDEYIIYKFDFNDINISNVYNTSLSIVNTFVNSTTNSSYTELQQAQVFIPQDDVYAIEANFEAYVLSGTGKIKIMLDTNTIGEITFTNTSSTKYILQNTFTLKAGKYIVSAYALNQNSSTTYIKNCNISII